MRSTIASAFALAVSVSALGGCAAQSGDSASGSSHLSASNDTVSDSSVRLLAAFDAVGGIDHASRGARGIRAHDLTCVTHSNDALSENHPLFQVPITECGYSSEGFSARFSTEDDPLPATLVFDAIVDVVAQDNVSHEIGDRSHVSVNTLRCEGMGLGAGADPNAAPPFTASCDLTIDGSGPIHVEGAPARRILRALDHAGATDHASGGTFGSNLSDLHCQKNGNGPLGAGDPMQGIATSTCDLVRDGQPAHVVDPKQDARALSTALEKVGLVSSHAAGGQTGVMAASVECFEGNGKPASCSVQE
jgi:hypothetical protein